MGDRPRTTKIKPLAPNPIIKDSYKAKIKLWLDNPVVMPWTPPKNIPFFGAKRFSSYVEFNEWKRDLIKQIAREET